MEQIEKKGRARLINYILSHAGEEIETREDYLKLAFMTLRELEQNVRHIKEYKRQQDIEFANNNF